MTAGSISLFYGGSLYEGWLSYEVDNDLRRPAGSFRLSAAPPVEFDAMVVEPGGIAELRIDGIPVSWGRVDDVDVRRRRRQLVMDISGRDAGGLLVDAAADITWAWRKSKLSIIAAQVCTYAGVIRPPVLSEDPVIDMAKAEPGERCWDLLERLTSARGLRLWIEPDGHLEIGQYDTDGEFSGGLRHVPGQVGNTIVSSTVRRSTGGAYSHVYVVGLYDSAGATARYRGEDIDTTFPYFKPELVVESDLQGRDAANAKAKEVATRARGSRFEYIAEVRGHLRATATPWTINALHHVDDDPNGIEELLLVVGRRFRRSREEGSRTELTLMRPEDLRV